jgi:uncharacterized protein (TIGR02466 family)|tara:strand:- start:38 stop:610 length:573 start_codon:yes stop_codon:yes gene_type:complete
MINEFEYLFATPIGIYKLDEDLKVLSKFAYNQTSNRSISNRGGIQTDDLNVKDKAIKPLCKKILEAGKSYAKQLRLTDNIFIENIWVNINKKHNFNVEHTHPFSLISGTFYVKTNKDTGNIVFANPNVAMEGYVKKEYVKEHNQLNSNVWWYTPQDNVLILFPSWLKHQVEPNQSEEDRISISFNINAIS